MSEKLRTVPWYDRNPITYGLLYSSDGVAPHAETARGTYTIPKGKMLLITSALINMKRATVATVAGAKVHAYIDLATGQGPPNVSARLLNAFFYGKDIDSGDKLCIAQCALMKPGDIITLYTADVAADGTVSYLISISGILFDIWPIEEEPFRKELPKKDIQEPDSVVKGQM